MKRNSFVVMLCVLVLLTTALSKAGAHGTHLMVVQPKEGALVGAQFLFEVHSKNPIHPYINLSIVREGDETPVLEELVALKNEKYQLMIDTDTWAKGTYIADVVLVGDFVKHPKKRIFVLE